MNKSFIQEKKSTKGQYTREGTLGLVSDRQNSNDHGQKPRRRVR